MTTRKSAYPREYKKFGIRYAHKPQEGSSIAGVVQVADSHGKGFSYIRFSEELELAIGKALPQGVGDAQPAYIKVVQSRSRNVWRVFAFYIASPVGVLLWETSDKPTWLHKVRRAENGGESTQTKGTSDCP